MNVGELKKVLESLPDETVVGVIDHYGDVEELADAIFHNHVFGSQKPAFVQLKVPDIGPFPD